MIQNSTVSLVIRSSLSIIDWEMLHIAKLRQEMAAIANSPVPVGNASILYRETHGGGDYLEISPLDALEREWADFVSKDETRPTLGACLCSSIS